MSPVSVQDDSEAESEYPEGVAELGLWRRPEEWPPGRGRNEVDRSFAPDRGPERVRRGMLEGRRFGCEEEMVGNLGAVKQQRPSACRPEDGRIRGLKKGEGVGACACQCLCLCL